MPYTFELLAPHHDRAAFSCGEPSLDVYIRQYAHQDMQRDLAKCYVLCEPGGPEIIGYYTLCSHAVEPAALPHERALSSGGYPYVPAVLIGRLAAATQYQGQGIGGLLLMDALWRTLPIPIGIKLIVVDALHETAATFYEHYGFRRFLYPPDKDNLDKLPRLYLPMAHVRTLFSKEAAEPSGA